jgi:hypothetical protein
VRVAYDGAIYPAEPVARGAAYELFADRPADGFLPNPRPGAQVAYRRFVPGGDVQVVEGVAPVPPDDPLRAPLSRALDWATVQRLSQSPPVRDVVAAIRNSVRIRPGTRMVRVLSAAQLTEYLHGALPRGFCYREHDVAHLRTPAELGVLRADGEDAAPGCDDVVFVLRWRAVDAMDYAIPYPSQVDGLVRMPPHHRLGPAVLGTGFAPSDQHLIPEWVTAHLIDLPLPAQAELVGYTADGTEVVLYRYLPEQRAWSRLVGPEWRQLLAHVPGVIPGHEYFPVPETPTVLVGWYRAQEFEAVADPPAEYRVLAKTRATRYPVEALARRTRYVRWRGQDCVVVRDDGDWLRVRLVRPDVEGVVRLGATCLERGVYETWAPYHETTAHRSHDVRYELTAPVAA